MAFLVMNECEVPAEEIGSPQCSLNGPVNRDNKSCPGFPLPPGVSAGTSIHSDSGMAMGAKPSRALTPAPCSIPLTSLPPPEATGPRPLHLSDGHTLTLGTPAMGFVLE